MSEDFKTRYSSSGYLQAHISKRSGHGSAELQGLVCPKCRHEFPLPPVSQRDTTCPKCGYTPPRLPSK